MSGHLRHDTAAIARNVTAITAGPVHRSIREGTRRSLSNDVLRVGNWHDHRAQADLLSD
jgi:hypothetical protein